MKSLKTADAGQSMAFFSHSPARAEAAMGTWAVIALLLVLTMLVIGGPL